MPAIPALVYEARIDPARVSLAPNPGTEQPPAAVPRGPASVPYGERWRLLATFNGGLKYTATPRRRAGCPDRSERFQVSWGRNAVPTLAASNAVPSSPLTARLQRRTAADG